MTDKPDMIAAEYALGLLTGDELRAAAVRAGSDPAFAEEVARWKGRLAPLHADVEAIPPPAGVWDRIAAAIGVREAANDNVTHLQRGLRRWRAAAGAMTALAASLAVVLLSQQSRAPTTAPVAVERNGHAPMVAMLGDQQAMKVVASWDPDARQLVLAVAGDMPADPAHAHQLWVIPQGGKARSIGIMPASKQMHMRLADALATLLQQGATIAISVEPAGGSPTGNPTGPVVASGALRAA
jgi:anti-sigma-K factor RskA